VAALAGFAALVGDYCKQGFRFCSAGPAVWAGVARVEAFMRAWQICQRAVDSLNAPRASAQITDPAWRWPRGRQHTLEAIAAFLC